MDGLIFQPADAKASIYSTGSIVCVAADHDTTDYCGIQNSLTPRQQFFARQGTAVREIVQLEASTLSLRVKPHRSKRYSNSVVVI